MMAKNRKAEKQLAALEKARAEALEAAKTPAWAHLLVALMAGAACTLGSFQTIPFLVAAFLLLLAAAVIGQRFEKRRGRIVDERSIGANFGYYFLLVGPMFIAQLILAPSSEIWMKVLAGAIATMCFFVFARVDEHYQIKRLSSGDYGPYDII